MFSFADDAKAVASGFFILGATSFALSTSVSMISLFGGYFMNPEDKVWKQVPPFSAIIPSVDKLKIGPKVMPEIVQRAKNAHRNHTENVVLLGSFYLVYLWSGADSATARNMIALSATMRVIYAFCYLFTWAPWRTIVHLVSQTTGFYVGFVGLSAIMSG